MSNENTIRVGVNGYGVIGKRVADAVRALTEAVTDASESITRTNEALGIRKNFLED